MKEKKGRLEALKEVVVNMLGNGMAVRDITRKNFQPERRHSGWSGRP